MNGFCTFSRKTLQLNCASCPLSSQIYSPEGNQKFKNPKGASSQEISLIILHTVRRIIKTKLRQSHEVISLKKYCLILVDAIRVLYKVPFKYLKERIKRAGQTIIAWSPKEKDKIQKIDWIFQSMEF